jgi:serine-type D-Ala-D-Ala carboxypeptidase (penicillin-binding protein 5/6)
MKFIFPILILIFLSTEPCLASSIKKGDPFPKAAASYVIQVNGKTLWAHNPDSRLPIASITKIMTSIIVLEHCNLDEIVTISDSVKDETGTRLGLRPGEKMSVRDLLAAALIKSACDACVALADYVGGSQEQFVAMMNEKAAELGLYNTHFQNAAGHDSEDHYSTANDIAKLTKTALRNNFFSQTVSVNSKKISTLDGKRVFRLKNTNDTLESLKGAKGVKTGFTPLAGKCLVSLAGRGGTEVLLILLNSPNRWKIAEKMMSNAFVAAAPKQAKR